MGRFTYLGRLINDVAYLARQRKAYWIVPLVLALIVMSVLVVVSQASAPFIYTLF